MFCMILILFCQKVPFVFQIFYGTAVISERGGRVVKPPTLGAAVLKKQKSKFEKYFEHFKLVFDIYDFVYLGGTNLG